MLFVQRWEQHLKWIAPLAIVAGFGVVYFFSPEQYAFYPQCLLRQLSGLECPGCGALRSFHYLTHGDFIAAFRLNPLLYVLAPALLVFRRRLHKPACLWALAALVAGFTIARNL
jgi:hypothetical protein